jgi:replicative superfamily II helicase
MKQKFNFVSACAGSGKTTTAMAAMAKGIALGERYVVAQPTKQLIESTVANQRNKLALGSAKIAVVTADHFPGSTHSAFITATLSCR